MWNMERIRLTASEEMTFENVDGRMTDDGRTDGRTPDACIYYKLTCEPTAQVVARHGMKAYPSLYLWSKSECVLINGYQDMD